MIDRPKILIPISGIINKLDLSCLYSFGRNASVELYLVDLALRETLFKRLTASWVRKVNHGHLHEAQREAIWQQHFYCEIRVMEASGLIPGIVEMARQVMPRFVFIIPKLEYQLGSAGLLKLKNLLCEICPCVLIFPEPGAFVRLDACPKDGKSYPEQIRLKF